MLQRENQLIRKELESSLINRKDGPSDHFDLNRYELEDLRIQNKDLKDKLSKMDRDLDYHHEHENGNVSNEEWKFKYEQV